MAAPTTKAPESKFYRRVIAADVLPVADQKQGLNCSNYETVHFQVIPSGGANPVVQLLFWSEAAAKFIPYETAVTIAAKGADVAYTFSYAVQGRIVLLAVTTLSAGAVDIYTSGFGWNSDLG